MTRWSVADQALARCCCGSPWSQYHLDTDAGVARSCVAELLAHRAVNPPPSSSLAAVLLSYARIDEHLGNGAVLGVDVALVEPHKIPDGYLQHSSQGPRCRA